jgi:hypothetical protein
MLNQNNLVGHTFEGYFQKGTQGHVQVDSYLRLIHDLRSAHPEFFGEDQRPLPIDDSRTELSIKILDYDPESGVVIGRGKDALGNSGLVGQIKGDAITLWKMYAGETTEQSGDQPPTSRLPMTLFQGTIESLAGSVVLSGDYMPAGMENSEGRWELHLQHYP